MPTLNEIVNLFETTYDVELSESGIEYLANLCLKYRDYKVYSATKICCDKYEDAEYSLDKIGGVLYNKDKDIKKYFK